MKKSDIAMLVLIASVSMGVAYFVAGALLKSPNEQTVKVKQVTMISPDIELPSSATFNKDAINPTVEVIIGDNEASSANK